MRAKKLLLRLLGSTCFCRRDRARCSAYYMRRAEQANFVLGKDHPIAKQEAVARDVYKRTFADGGFK